MSTIQIVKANNLARQSPQGPYGSPRIVQTKTKGRILFDPNLYHKAINPPLYCDLSKPLPGQAIIVQFSGPTGAGKGDMTKLFLEEVRGSRRLTTCTTRDIREGEERDVHYKFLTEEEFDGYAAAGEFIETNTLDTGKRYGTLRSFLIEQMNRGEILVSDIDFNGAHQMRQKSAELPGLVLDIFLMLPGSSVEEMVKECRRRIENDGNRDRIQDRLDRIPTEVAAAADFSYTVVNDDRRRALARILEIVTEARVSQWRALNYTAV